MNQDKNQNEDENNQKCEDELTVKNKNKKTVNPNNRERAIREVEVNELLDAMKFDNTEKEIIILKVDGNTLDEIKYVLGLKISKQSIEKN